MRLRFACAALLAVIATPATAEKFHFVALGDTAYNLPQDIPVWHGLIDSINAADPAFSIHVGDIWGRQECVDENYLRVRSEFNSFTAPLIYTPGDNEWVDCLPAAYYEALKRKQAGKATPADEARLAYTFENRFNGVMLDDGPARLADIRRLFFSEPQSLGASPMPVTRQADVSQHQQMTENLRWTHDDVLFATFHATGSDDSQLAPQLDRLEEAQGRLLANVDWIREVFAEAERTDAKAVVLATQAGLFDKGPGRSFVGAKPTGGRNTNLGWLVRALREYAVKWGKPVLIINGDFHEFVVDKPLLERGADGSITGDNITRLQVFGAPDLRAVKVSVDTDTPWVFGFEPLW